jgi:hypothetical protein
VAREAKKDNREQHPSLVLGSAVGRARDVIVAARRRREVASRVAQRPGSTVRIDFIDRIFSSAVMSVAPHQRVRVEKEVHASILSLRRDVTVGDAR